MNQKISVRLILLILLALIGLGCSIALSQHFYDLRSGSAGFKSYCNVSAKMNCDVVAASTWAEVAPGLPIASVAAGWYAGLFFIFLSAVGFNVRREAMKTAMILGSVSAAASIFYLYVMSARIGTYCLLCLVLDAVNFISLGLIYSLTPKGTAQTPSAAFAHWKSFAAVMGVCLFIAIVGLKGLDSASPHGPSGGSDKEIAQSVMSREPIAMNLTPLDLSIGPADAAVTIVEFSDFQCPFCRIGAFTLHSVMSRFPNQVRVVMKTFPLDPSCNHFVNHSMHPVACDAARTAVCASRQGRFDAVYESLFQNQESLAPGKPAALAQEVGVDMTAFNACMADNASLTQVQTSIEEGGRLAVEATPTFYVNGHRVPDGVPSLSAWSEIIQQLLATPTH